MHLPLHPSALRSLWILLWILTILGCPSEPGVHEMEGSIGPDGGTLQLSSGAALILPAGAMSEPTVLGIGEVPPPPLQISGFAPLGPFFRLSPAGQTFDHPVSILLPFSPELAGNQVAQVRIFLSSDEGDSWKVLPRISHPSPSLTGGQTTHFSLVVAGLPIRDVEPPLDPPVGSAGGGTPLPGSSDGCGKAEGPGCSGCSCEAATCSVNPDCCLVQWSSSCVRLCSEVGECGQETGSSGEPGPCEGHCDEQAPEGCYCDSICVESADCCGDACSTCGHCPPVCGDQACGKLETCEGCPQDCGECGTCGDEKCTADETCESCPADCGVCLTFCGDGTCTSFETCENCILDCGECGFESSCIDNCGDNAPSGCWCDTTCVQNADCCADVCAACDICS